MTFKPFLLRVCCAVACGIFGAAWAGPCDNLVAAQTWNSKLTANSTVQDEYLDQLRNCLPGQIQAQALLDSAASAALQLLDDLAPQKQKATAQFIAEALEVNARLGYAPSQHNYAVLFNARPSTTIAKLIPQDPLKFAQWTRAAAAQGEPRSVFNLALRMSSGAPKSGIEQDLETAYQLFLGLDRLEKAPELSPSAKALLQDMRSYINNSKARIASALGPQRIKELTALSTKFDYASLAPRSAGRSAPNGRAGNGNWDHEKNIRTAVEDFFNTQTAVGNEEVLKKTKACYAAQRNQNGFSADKEYCVALDVANIEYTSLFYQVMAARYGTDTENLQPEDTRRSVGRRRIIREMLSSQVDSAELVVETVYRQTQDILMLVLTQISAPAVGGAKPR